MVWSLKEELEGRQKTSELKLKWYKFGKINESRHEAYRGEIQL